MANFASSKQETKVVVVLYLKAFFFVESSFCDYDLFSAEARWKLRVLSKVISTLMLLENSPEKATTTKLIRRKHGIALEIIFFKLKKLLNEDYESRHHPIMSRLHECVSAVNE